MHSLLECIIQHSLDPAFHWLPVHALSKLRMDSGIICVTLMSLQFMHYPTFARIPAFAGSKKASTGTMSGCHLEAAKIEHVTACMLFFAYLTDEAN